MRNTGDAQARRPRLQRGAVSVIVAVSIVMLCLVLGLVLDLGRLYVVKTEMQNAADACALAAVRRLPPWDASTVDRATSAGISVGTQNRVDFQSADIEILQEDIGFSTALAGEYTRDPAQISSATLYARCTPHGSGGKSVALWIMRLAGTQSAAIAATAIARLGPSQTHYALPIGLCTQDPGQTIPASKIYWGLEVGQWYGGRLGSGSGVTGNYDWMRFPGQPAGAREVADLIAFNGRSDLGGDETISSAQAGVDQGIAQAWNTRFGLYTGTYKDRVESPPDYTGFAYAWNPEAFGATGAGGSWPPTSACKDKATSCNAYADFKEKRKVNAPYDPASILDDKGRSEKLPGSPSPSSTAQHAAPNGTDRRVAIVPIIRCADWKPGGENQQVYGWACILLLQPIVSDPKPVLRMEFLGPDYDAPCTTSGLPGMGGALTPQLVE